MGRPLRIYIPTSRKVGEKIRVQIFYSTTEKCTAVQWLDKEYVPHPFVTLSLTFSQEDAGKGVPLHVQSMPAHICA